MTTKIIRYFTQSAHAANRNAFTLVELMVTISILSIGLILVLRSFILTSSAIDSSYNLIKAMQFLETKMNSLEQEIKEEGVVALDDTQGEVKIGNRSAVWRLEIIPLDVVELKEDIDEARLSIVWREGSKHKDAILVTYLEKKK